MKPSPGPRAARPMSSRFASGTASSRSASRSPPAKPGARDRAGVERRPAARPSAIFDPAVEREQMPPPGHRRIDQQPADAEPADVDVDVGQQRRVRDRRAAAPAGGSAAPRGCRATRMSIWLRTDRRTADSRARPPARGRRCRCGSASETSCRRQLAEHRALDPLDMDLEARDGLERVDLADDEAAARIGVQPEQEGAEQQRRRRAAAIAAHLATVTAGWRRRTTIAPRAIRRPARSRRRR